jgi:hypothetical protein
MATNLSNVSFDGSPVQFRMDSPLLACFDPLALDLLGELLPPGIPFDVLGLLERANSHQPTLACFTIPDFQPGVYTLDPRDIRKFGDEDEEFDYDAEEMEPELTGTAPSYPFAAVDSGALIIADVRHLPTLVGLLTWEQYDRCLQDGALFGTIVEELDGPYFAIVHGGCMPGMEFDGDGTYTIPVRRLSRVSGCY